MGKRGDAAQGGVARLGARHTRLAYLVAAGLSHAEIARLTGYSPVHVGVIARSPLFRALVASLIEEQLGPTRDAVMDTLREAAPAVAAGMVELARESGKEGVRFRASAYVLDRVLPRQPREEADDGLHIHVHAADRRRLDDLAEEADEVEGEVVPAALPPPTNGARVETLEEARAWAKQREREARV